VKMKKFSVILTYWERPELLSRALYCLVQQTYGNFEVVPSFDGHSSPGLWVYDQFLWHLRRDHHYHKKHQYAANFRPPVVFNSGERGHHGNSCRRHALSYCNGDYVIWYGHDNLIDKDFLETHGRQIQDDSCVSVVGQHYFTNRYDAGCRTKPENYISYRGRLPFLEPGEKEFKKRGTIDLLQYAVPLDVAKRWAFLEEDWPTYEADWQTLVSIRKNEPDLEVRVNPAPVCSHF